MASESFRNWRNETLSLHNQDLVNLAVSEMETLSINYNNNINDIIGEYINDDDYYENDESKYHSDNSTIGSDNTIPSGYRAGTIISHHNQESNTPSQDSRDYN
eukprot:239212_1